MCLNLGFGIVLSNDVIIRPGQVKGIYADNSKGKNPVVKDIRMNMLKIILGKYIAVYCFLANITNGNMFYRAMYG